MTKAATIRRAEIKRRGVRHLVRAFAGLQFLKGNSAPYFTLTGSVDRIIGDLPDGRVQLERDSGESGCIHETLLRHFPDLQALADLHLSDLQGAPMHAEGNGLYWIAGAMASPHAPNLPVWGQRYHGASGTSGRTPAECLDVAARHYRLTPAEVMAFAEPLRYAAAPAVREAVKRFTDAQRERWQAEAEAAIPAYGLTVCGDVDRWRAIERERELAPLP